jgi:hypothetical protein
MDEALSRRGEQPAGGRRRTSDLLRLPRAHWRTLRTTNAIERLNGEFRRRVKTQSALPSEDTAVVLLFSLGASGQIVCVASMPARNRRAPPSARTSGVTHRARPHSATRVTTQHRKSVFALFHITTTFWGFALPLPALVLSRLGLFQCSTGLRHIPQ